MAYVPGFQHDVFVSYAHGDDRPWIDAFVKRLQSDLDDKLGSATDVWLDAEDNRPSRDFSREIPDAVRSSAVFLLLASPTYIRSAYCVDVECKVFGETLDERRGRFQSAPFANEQFALRCPILPIDNNDHWALFPGLTDIAFGDATGTFPLDTADFKRSFGRLVGELADLLKRMRNHSTAVFLYPASPGPDLHDTHAALTAELTARSYRVLPDRRVKLPEQLLEAALSVFLVGEHYDETAGELVEVASQQRAKPWVVWCSPSVENATVDQAGFHAHLEQLDSTAKTYLKPGILPAKLKEEVLALLKPPERPPRDSSDRPSVYLVYNARDAAERKNAGIISYTFRKEIHFEHPDNPAEHTRRLAHSDGVLLVWGNADEEWCSREFLEIVQASRRPDANGLCVFDPKEPKAGAIAEIRKSFGDHLYIGEQFGSFNAAVLEPFFTPLRRRLQDDAP
jgi:hypothetical protein